jgi:benzoylsuccinyl-CoA thiolase BbsA subunit
VNAERITPRLSVWPSTGSAAGSAGGEAAPCLIGARCRDCAKLWFPSGPVCPSCRSQAIEPAPLSREGRLYAWSRLHVAARGWAAPYVIGYVDLPEGVRVFAHIAADPAALRPDMPVAFRTATPVVNSEGQEVIHFVFVPVAGD